MGKHQFTLLAKADAIASIPGPVLGACSKQTETWR